MERRTPLTRAVGVTSSRCHLVMSGGMVSTEHHRDVIHDGWEQTYGYVGGGGRPR